MPEPGKHAVRRVVQTALGMIWAIEESVLSSIVEILQLRSEGFAFTEDEVHARIEARRARDDMFDAEDGDGPRRVGKVAVLPMYGVMAPRLNMFQRVSGGTSTEQVAAWFKQAVADPNVAAIVLDIDSPGGDARGNEELASLIRENRDKKPVTTVFTGMGASAAYYVGSAASEVVASPSTEVGSIGTFMIHGETSKADAERGVKYTVIKAGENKAVGNQVEPLSDKAKATLQERIDAFNDQFVAAVAANRGVSVETVNKNFGSGKVMIAAAAKEAGLVDRIATLDEVVSQLNQSLGGTAARPAAPTRAKDRTMNKNVMTLLGVCGLVAAEATEEQCQAALQAFYVARGKSVPASAEQQEADLTAFKSEIASAGERQLQVARTAAAAEERNRIADLTARGKLLNIAAEDIQAAIDGNLTVGAALTKWTEKLAEGDKAVSTVKVIGSHDDKFASAAVEALSHRLGVAKGEPSQGAKELRFAKLSQLAEKSLAAQGIRTAGMDDEDIARAALRGTGEEIRVGAVYASGATARPGDFPNLLSNLAGKMLEPVPDYAGATFREWATQISSVSDFKPKTLIATGEFGEFPMVPDGAPFEDGDKPSEEASFIAVDKYGDEWKLTPVMIANDDLDAFSDAVMDKNAAHDLTLNRLCVDLITGNVTLPDGYSLFDDTNHGNDLSTGLAPSQTQLAAMRLKLRKQTGVSDKRKLNYNLAHLLVPEDIETTTEQLLADLQVVPVTDTTTNTFRRRVTFSVEPMLGEHSAVKYYGFAPPRLGRAIVYTYMRGYERMKVTNYFDQKTGCRVWQFEGRMAAAVRNYRAIVRNAGTGG